MVGTTPTATTPLLPNEDAVAIATDFFHSMDNVSNEVEHILKEIAYKDERLAEIQTRLTQRTTAVLRNAKNNTHSSSTPSNPSQTPAAPPLNPLSAKDHQAYAKITAEWNKIDLIQAEKTALATRLVSIVTRHKERGREEYKKIVGDEVVELLVKAEREVDLSSPVGLAQMVHQYTGGAGMIVAGSSSSGGIAAAAAGVAGTLGSGSGLGALGSRGDSQRGSMGPGTISTVTASDERTTKKRKSTHMSGTVTPSYHDMPPPAPPAIHLPANHTNATINLSPALHPGLPSYHQHIPVSSRGSGQGRKGRLPSQTPEVDIDMDAEGDNEEGADDNALYCFCQEKSYGEMIGCDNAECRFEWFHLKCVKLEPPLPETWFCPDCVAVLEYEDSNGKPKQKQKGRKK